MPHLSLTHQSAVAVNSLFWRSSLSPRAVWSSYLPTLKPGCPAHLLSITPGSIEHLSHSHLFFFLRFYYSECFRSFMYSVYTHTHTHTHTHTQPPPLSSPTRVPHLLQLMNPHRHVIVSQSPQFTLGSSLDVELSVGFDKGMVGSQVKNPPAIAGDAGDSGFIPVGKIPWSRKWQPTPVFLPGRSHGQRSLAGCSPQGGKSQT